MATNNITSKAKTLKFFSWILNLKSFSAVVVVANIAAAFYYRPSLLLIFFTDISTKMADKSLFATNYRFEIPLFGPTFFNWRRRFADQVKVEGRLQIFQTSVFLWKRSGLRRKFALPTLRFLHKMSWRAKKSSLVQCRPIAYRLYFIPITAITDSKFRT